MADEELLRIASKDKRILAFYCYETTGTYCFDYFQNGQHIRRKWFSDSDDNIDQSENFGSLLAPEKIDGDHLETIFNLIGSVLGKQFYDIELEEKMYHFKVVYGRSLDSAEASSTEKDKKGL